MFDIAQRLHREGKRKEAEDLYRKILLSFPNHAQALHGLGVLCAQHGSFHEGLLLLERALSFEPNNQVFHIDIATVLMEHEPEKSINHFRKGIPEPEAYIGLFTTLEMLGRVVELQELIVQFAEEDATSCFALGKISQHQWSELCLKALLSSSSCSLEILLNCAQIYIDAQEPDEALPFLEKACVRNPQMREGYILIGDIHMKAYRYVQALQAYQDANHIDPEHHETYGKLGYAALALEKIEIAKELFRRSLLYKKDQSVLYCQLADLVYEEGDKNGAEEYWKEALKIEPADLHSGYRLVQLFFSSYPPRYQEAEKLLDILRKKHPKESSVHNMIGHLHFIRGDRDRALLSYQKTVECNPSHTSVYHQLARYAPEPLRDQIPVWKDLLIHGGLKDDKRSHLAFALGSTYDRIGNVESAFSYFATANEIERRLRICSISDIQNYLHHQCTLFEGLDVPPLQKNPRFIFVVGMMRSGSTLLEQLMCARPDLYSVGELPRIPQLVSDATNPSRDSFSSIRSSYIETVETYPDTKKVCLDKMLGNFAYIGWIRHAFPDARILHCVRDPMDTCWSIYRHRFVGNHPYAYQLEELTEYYSIYQSVMSFWKRLYPEFILDVSYEDIVSQTNDQCEVIDSFCSLDCTVIRRAHQDNHSMISTPSGMNARKEVYTHAIGRSKRYSAFLTPFCAKLYQ